MEKQQSITTKSRRTVRPLRVIWHVSSVIVASLWLSSAVTADAGPRRARLSSDLQAMANGGTAEVIVSGSQEKIARIAQRNGLTASKLLSSGAVFRVSKQALDRLAQDQEVESLSGNARVHSHGALTTDVTGADAVWAGKVASLGRADGSGIGVAVIDSGIAADHPALVNRVLISVDFTDPRGRGYDFYGHGTHIAGTIAARSFNNVKVDGADSGMAPAAHLINLKVLDANGEGSAADVVEAIDFAIKFRKVFGIRVINLSLGAAPTQSYKDDPLCLAVQRAVEAGIVVVASAGNYGQSPDGKLVYGSITSPGISPYAITVGALRTNDTLDRGDDEVAPWSSKGPTMIDHIVKPDLVAPGSKIVSAGVKTSTLATEHPERFLDGPGARDYLSLSGTSMAAAVVSGAAALVLDGRSDLTPFQVKLALQASADFMPREGLLTSGAGSLDLRDLSHLGDLRIKTGQYSTAFSMSVPGKGGVSSQIIVWGNIIVWGERVTWGEIIVWGNSTKASDIIVWGNATKAQDIIVWGNSLNDIIVWGNSTQAADIIVWGNKTSAQDIIVWGNSLDDIIVWGNSTKAADIIVWGNSTADIIVWGNSADIIVWGN